MSPGGLNALKRLRLGRRVKILFYGSGRHKHWLLMLLATFIGIICGYGAIGFYKGIGYVLSLFYGTTEEVLASHAASLPWYHILIATTLGGFLVGQLLRLLPENRPYSVADAIECAALRSGNMDVKSGVVSAFATVLSLGAGASAGREGPVVHLGATISSFISRTFKLPPKSGQILLGCGVASAVAASFNAPLAGVFFALEIVIGHYALHTFTPIVIAAIAGTLISRVHLGEYPAFAFVDVHIVSAWEFPAFFILGVVAAIFAVIFMMTMDWGNKVRERINHLPYWLHPVIGGILLGIIGIFFPEVLSVGYEATSKALIGDYGLLLLLLLVVFKTLATTITLASRFGGGIFSPSLFLGAMLGSAFGIIIGQISPEYASSPAVYAIIGMGAVASATLGAPISTMLIIFEITGDYNVTLAVMIASAVSSLLSTVFYKQSYFHLQLANRGVYLEGGKATYLLKTARVSDHMSRDFFTVSESETVKRASDLLMAQGGGYLIVTNDVGVMTGSICLTDIPHNMTDEEAAEQTAGRISRSPPMTVRTTDPLQYALSRLENSGEEMLPVLSSDDTAAVVGVIKLRNVMKEYNRALLEAQGRDDE
ncbi:chloride channel protein [Kordiimonas sediminis]|uniref:Chloride channel protein n=1 Tax=Kordiimonas sediminis TaxID=1735581 RepID=A0A919E5L2_9PROT|nr:chloride channel protein [Kordiimonas sediminis]GHF21188.1 chloride channel protein [Kordiimonas sediminis]